VFIHEVQGAGAESPLEGSIVVVEGIVVGDFQDDFGAHGDLNGFFVQEEDADADGVVTLDADRLYKLVKLEQPGMHLLRIEFLDGNSEVYAFTFG